MPPVTPAWVRGVSLHHPDPAAHTVGSRLGTGQVVVGCETGTPWPRAAWQGHRGRRAAPVRHCVYKDLEEPS